MTLHALPSNAMAFNKIIEHVLQCPHDVDVHLVFCFDRDLNIYNLFPMSYLTLIDFVDPHITLYCSRSCMICVFIVMLQCARQDMHTALFPCGMGLYQHKSPNRATSL